MYKPHTSWEHCVEFHGHSCPGLAIGYRTSLAAIDRLGITFSNDEELVCITENNACGVDAVQVVTGCSLGKGNLIFRDTGKQVFSFFNRRENRSLRILFKGETLRQNMDKSKAQQFILNAPEEELFAFSTPSLEPPQRARIFKSIVCELCNESASELMTRIQGGKKVCLDCFIDYSRGW